MDAFLNANTCATNGTRRLEEFCNGTTHSHHHDFVGEAMSVPVLVVLGSLHALSILNGVLGNTLLLVALFTDKPFRILSNTYSVYLVNLVLVDLYLLAYYFPMMLAGLLLGRYPAVNHTHCVVTGYLAAVSYQAFLLTLLLISLDRCMRVCHYDLYRTYVTKRNAVFACLLTWLAAASIILPVLLEGSFAFNRKVWSCTLMKAKFNRYIGWTFMAGMVSPVVGYAALNCQTYYKIRKTRQREACRSLRGAENRQRFFFGPDIILLRSVLVMFVCLLVCLIPTTVVHLVGGFVDIPVEVYAFCSLLMSVNSSVSWIVCGLTNARFRERERSITIRRRKAAYRGCSGRDCAPPSAHALGPFPPGPMTDAARDDDNGA
ncbi:hypothetical protein BaRGS_00012082, partial [Batillaria attramentaria]